MKRLFHLYLNLLHSFTDEKYASRISAVLKIERMCQFINILCLSKSVTPQIPSQERPFAYLTTLFTPSTNNHLWIIPELPSILLYGAAGPFRQMPGPRAAVHYRQKVVRFWNRIILSTLLVSLEDLRTTIRSVNIIAERILNFGMVERNAYVRLCEFEFGEMLWRAFEGFMSRWGLTTFFTTAVFNGLCLIFRCTKQVYVSNTKQCFANKSVCSLPMPYCVSSLQSFTLPLIEKHQYQQKANLLT